MTERFLALAAVFWVALLAAPAGHAQAPQLPADADTTRFSYHRLDDGFARLDLRTGQVSVCAKRAAGWACQASPDDRAAWESEIGRLQAENAALKKALLDRGLPLPDGVKAPPPAARAPAPVGPSDADLDQVMSFVEKIWRRLVEMMSNIQRDLGKT